MSAEEVAAGWEESDSTDFVEAGTERGLTAAAAAGGSVAGYDSFCAVFAESVDVMAGLEVAI